MQQTRSSGSTSKGIVLVLVGAGIGVLLIVLVLFSSGEIELAPGDMHAVQEKFRELEGRIARLEDTKERIIFLQKQERAIKERIAAYPGGEMVPLEEQVESLSERVERLEKAVAAGASKPGGISPRSGEASPVPGGRYHMVHQGDTLSKIANQYGISVEQLCRLNNMTPYQVIYPGERLLVAPAASQ
jgi:LysM repeat protein